MSWLTKSPREFADLGLLVHHRLAPSEHVILVGQFTQSTNYQTMLLTF